MDVLRRLLGGGGRDPVAGGGGEGGEPVEPVDDQARERELLLEDARRLDDELLQRQLRYADRSWTPPPQGGPRRADDGEATAGD